MNVTAGTCFWAKHPRSPVEHLCVVLTDADATQRVVVVNITTMHEGTEDCSCRLDHGEHLDIDHTSVINFTDGAMADARKITEGYFAGVIRLTHEMPALLLDRIQQAAAGSVELPLGCRTAVRNQIGWVG